MKHLKARQKGISLSGILTTCVILGLVAILAAKVVPAVSEYTDILREVKAVANDPSMHGASVRDIKVAFAKRAEVDYIQSITAEDLDITKDDDRIVIAFAYSRKIPLFYNASLVLDFEGSSSPTAE